MGPYSLGPRDAELLAFIASHRAALPAQLAALTGLRPSTVRNRLQALGRAGLVRHRPVASGHPAARLITPAGLQLLGRPAGRSELKPAEYLHDIAAGWLWLAARDGAFGPVRAIRTERELRSHDGLPRPAGDSDREPLGVRRLDTGPRGRERLHHPDLELETAAGQRVAIELELTPKADRELDGILAAYAADPRVDAVVYVIGEDGLEAKVRRAAARAGAEGKLFVRRFGLSPELQALATAVGHRSAGRAVARGRPAAAGRMRADAPEASR